MTSQTGGVGRPSPRAGKSRRPELPRDLEAGAIPVRRVLELWARPAWMGGAAMLLSASAAAAVPTDKPMFAFGGAAGAAPVGPLVPGGPGAFYGVTSGGGGGAGVVFKLQRPTVKGDSWTETVLYSFTGAIDGGTPMAALVRSDDGTLIGTTAYGGDATSCPATGSTPAGCGVVFKLLPPARRGEAWVETVIHTFGGADGAHPFAELTRVEDGVLFGTTRDGGANGAGTVFRIDVQHRAIVETVLYSFTGGADGGSPYAGLRHAHDKFFGTTVAGGDTADCPASAGFAAGCGVVFELEQPKHRGDAWTETVLHSFTGATDGGYPYAGVTKDDAGRLFGTTSAGGNTADCPGSASFGAGCGVVYELSAPDAFGVRSLGVIYAFSGGADGRAPLAPVTLRAGHQLFGTTFAGGAEAAGCDPLGCGTVFEIASALSGGVVKKGIVWSFTGGDDGANPAAHLVSHDHGEIFGTTEAGGANGAGVAYRIPK